MPRGHITMRSEPYFVAHPSPWPIVTALGLALLLGGFGILLHGGTMVPSILGAIVLLYAVVRWFAAVIGENQAGYYNTQVNRSFRLGMAWFIFSEVMLFAALFGALFYVRELAVPWLGGEGAKGVAHLLWPHFVSHWPLLEMPRSSDFDVPTAAMSPVGIPAFNTAVLLTSGLTVTLAHWALKRNARRALGSWLLITILLGASFVVLQVHEYAHAYRELDLTLHSGVYGSTFYLLTGFHGAHVTLGVIMLSVMLGRSLKGHFTPTEHFGFEAASWYWHFVDVVWLGLYLFVYWW
jgi:cytochrome c oxidase subunit 3